ncbi:hypothetical protein P4S72_18770 [Vibrio sp. PP-XX7]
MLLGSVDENMNYTVAIFNVLCLALITPLVVALVTLLFVDWRLGLLLLVIFPLLIPCIAGDARRLPGRCMSRERFISR